MDLAFVCKLLLLAFVFVIACFVCYKCEYFPTFHLDNLCFHPLHHYRSANSRHKFTLHQSGRGSPDQILHNFIHGV